MEIRVEPGWRYTATIQGRGQVEGVVLSRAGADSWEDGDVIMPRWSFKLDSGEVIEVQEAELGPIINSHLGEDRGPVVCAACKGSGIRPKPGSLSSQKCGNCKGAGISYPDS